MNVSKKESVNHKKNKKIHIIKNFDEYIGKCTVENLQILGDQLRNYNSQPNLITKNSESLKDLIQLLFKFLMDGDKNLEEDIIGCFKDEDIFEGIKNIYFHENYEINCTIIQSLSILIVNIVKSKSFLYFILSNNFINDLLLIDFSKYDDEFFSYYVNFLKSLAMRLDENTFLLFYNKRSNLFPLLDCSILLYNYSNPMIRTVVNNIFLQILKSNITNIQEKFTKLPAINYFCFISLRMKDLIDDLSKNNSNNDPFEDLIDISLFVNDLLILNKPKISFIVRNSVFYYFLLPGIFQSLYFLYNDELIKGNKNNCHKQKESIIILGLITFLINIRDETCKYIILQLFFSEKIPEQIINYAINNPENNPFYSYKWDKDFQKKITFSKFMSMNYSLEFLESFTNKDNYYFRNEEKIGISKTREMRNIQNKCEEINEMAKIDNSKKENYIYQMSQFIFDIFNEKAEQFGQMKNYHQNLGKGLGIKIGVIKEMFQNPNFVNTSNQNEKKYVYDGIDIINGEIVKDCFMFDYKIWMDNLDNENYKGNDNENNMKLKDSNDFKASFLNLLCNEKNKNVNINIPLVIMNNYFIWTITHKITTSKTIMNHFYLNISTSSEIKNNNICTSSQNSDIQNKDIKEDEKLYNKFVFDEKFLVKKLKNTDIKDYKLNDILIEKLCLILENKILLFKVELKYVELICKNIYCLYIDNQPNQQKEHTIIKNTLIKLITTLSNFIQIPDTESIEQNSSIEEIMANSLEIVINNFYDDSIFNKQLDNLTQLLEIISKYEKNEKKNENLFKGTFVNNVSLAIIYLYNILLKYSDQKSNDNPFICLYKKIKYNMKEILDENNLNNRYHIIFQQKSKILIYDDLFLYHFYLTKGKEREAEIKDVIFIKNSNETKSKSKEKITFKINNEIFINFNCNEEEEKESEILEQKYRKLKNDSKIKFSKESQRFKLNNILKYADKL